MLRRVEERLSAIPEVSHFFSFAGAGGAQNANVFVALVPRGLRRRNQQQVQGEINGLRRTVPDLRGVAADFSLLGAGGRSEDVQLVITGPELAGLDRYSREIMERLDQTAGYVGVTRDSRWGSRRSASGLTVTALRTRALPCASRAGGGGG